MKSPVFINEQLQKSLGNQYAKARWEPHGMGCINETWKLSGEGLQPLFIKLGNAEAASMYRAEREGLQWLRQAESFRLPEVYLLLVEVDYSALVMEFIDLRPVNASQARVFGLALAELHRITLDRYGLATDNYIGRTPQLNGWHGDWWRFFADCRLAPQLELAAKQGLRQPLCQQLQALLPAMLDYFADWQPAAALLHGDLWSGNTAVDTQGQPVFFDPAVYYGDALTDLAMSRLFQPLPAAVYQAYGEVHAPEPEAELRTALYDLYHWLNHFNLFGVNYLGQIEQSLCQLQPLF